MRQIDVSELAQLGTVGLLAGKVRVLLDRRKRDEVLTESDLANLGQASRFLREALEGLRELQRFENEFSFGDDKLEAVLTLRTAARAVSGSGASAVPREDLRSLGETFARVLVTLGALHGRTDVRQEAIEEADALFRSLCSYASAARRSLVHTATEGVV